jgi:hypothetical protein
MNMPKTLRISSTHTFSLHIVLLEKLTLVRGMRKSRVFLDEARCAQLYRDHGIRIFPDYQGASSKYGCFQIFFLYFSM